MPFDRDRFINTGMKPRMAVVAVSDMADFFAPDNAEWTVRGLTGQELGQAKAAVAARKDIAALVSNLLAGQSAEKADAVKRLFDLGEDVPPDVALRIHLLRLGSVSPAADEETAVKICTCFPIEFAQLTQRILELTGQGHEPGKSGASGETPSSGAV